MLGALEEQFGVELPLGQFFEQHKPTLLGKIGSEIKVFGDVEGCLSRLADKQVALATSSPGWYVKAILEAFQVLQQFKHVVCADDVINGKPHPEAFLTAAAGLGVDPQDCVAIEDSANGVASAKAAGCYTIGVRRDSRIDLSQADEIIESLDRLPSGTGG
jgi:HAD superfamily hydrolase (TIGR01509 family)